MKQKLSGSKLIILTILPAVLLALSSLYLVATERLGLPPYLMLCISGLCSLTGCLLWGGGLCTRALRPAALRVMVVITALLAMSCAIFFVSGLPAAQAAGDVLFAVSAALLMPMPLLLSRFVAASRETERRKDPVFFVLLGLSLAAVLFALSDPFHGLLFDGRSYGVGTWILLGFFMLGVLFAQIRLLACSRRFTARMLPLAVLAALEVAAGVFCATSGVLEQIRSILSYFAALMIYATLTFMLVTDLLPDGRVWPGLLQHTTFPVQLMDREGTIVYGADLALPITQAHKSAILSNRCPMILEKDMELSVSVIRGGYALQQKDLRDLHALQETLDSVKKELKETYALLARESELEAKLQRLTKKNVFFARQEAKIQEKTDRASLLLRCAAASSPKPGFRRAVVTRANVLVTYIQNLGLLLREAKETDLLPVDKLADALELSAKAATAAGTRCRVYHVAQGTFPAAMVIALYDLHELVLEEVLANELPALEIRLRNEQGGPRLVLAVPDAELETMERLADRIRVLAEDAGGTAAITEENGCVTVGMEFGGA